MGSENQGDLPMDRRRGSKKLYDMGETPLTNFQNLPMKSQLRTNGNNHLKASPSCLHNTRCYFCNFCENTSIHGFKFLGEEGRYVVEKVWWFLVVCGAVIGSGSLIYKTYHKWITSPVVVTFAMTETPIWEIPFPAVTVCAEYKINVTVFNLTDVYLKYIRGKNTTEDEDEYFDIAKLVCNEHFSISDDMATKILNEEALGKFWKMLTYTDLVDCRWLGRNYDCEHVMSYRLTNEGWCRTFNMLANEEVYTQSEDYYENRSIENTTARKWSLEGGYPSSADLDTFPHRTILSGSKSGFELELFADDGYLDYLCSALQGFKVTLHHPAEEPDMDRHFRVPLDEAVIVGIRPRMITTAEEIRSYSPEDRQCYLQGEKALSSFKIYTQQNCMTECLTNYTIKSCGCKAFYMTYNGDAEVCGTEKKECMTEAKVSFLTHDVSSKIKKSEDRNLQRCGCLPGCTSLEFDSETSQTEWNWKKSLKIGMEKNDFRLETAHYSKVIVYYKDMQFMTSERHELYGTIDFLANCGGLLGLFCGFSFTSAIEIIYYLTLRFICNSKKFGRKVWSGAPELNGDKNEQERQH